MRKIKLILISLIITSTCFSQDVKVVQDLRLRNSLGIEKEITKRIALFGEVEIGLEENCTQIGKLHGEVGIDYSPLKYLSLQSKYRFTKNRKNYSEEYKYTHLFALSAEGRYKIKRFKTYYRLQYQNLDEDQFFNNTEDANKNLFKNRIKLKYNIKGTKLTPYIAPELYILVARSGLKANKLKTIVGVEYEFKKKHKFKLYYRNDKEMTMYFPYMYHTFGLSYNFTL